MTSRPTALGVAGVVCSFLSTYLMNYGAFPAYRAISYYSPDIGTVVAVGLLVALALVAFHSSRPIPSVSLCVAACSVAVAAVPLAMSGITRDLPWLVACASLCVVASSVWCSVASALAICALPRKRVMPVVTLALVVAYLMGWAVVQACDSARALLGVLAIAQVAGPLFSQPGCGSFFEPRADGASPQDAAVTNPASYLPFSSQLFIVLFISQVVFGYSVTYVGTASFFLPALVFVALMAIPVLGRRGAGLDLVFEILVLVTVASLVMPSAFDADSSWINPLLSSTGSAGFTAFSVCVFVAVAQRNQYGAAYAVAWGVALTTASIVAGALLGYVAQWLSAAGIIGVSGFSTLVALLVVACALIGLRGFSFSSIIEGITPDTPVTPLAAAAGAPSSNAGEMSGSTSETALDIDARCEHLADEHRLTPRERDVLRLLARGRNGGVIQDELGISRNTVKVHVSHIYAKLGIHSQQDLIDLVELAGEEAS